MREAVIEMKCTKQKSATDLNAILATYNKYKDTLQIIHRKLKASKEPVIEESSEEDADEDENEGDEEEWPETF